MLTDERVLPVLCILSRETRRGRYGGAPVYQSPMERQKRTPFTTLVGCLISTRTRDEQTRRICRDLFAVAPGPEALLELSATRLERMLHGAGFYRQKTKHLKRLARIIVDRGGVPRTREELLELPGIGPKCANIVLANCFQVPAIAVDTHVHRISNRLGWIRTDTPEETEQDLTPLVPIRWRRRINVLLVAHGQLVCRPVRPRCGECPVLSLCSHASSPTRTRP